MKATKLKGIIFSRRGLAENKYNKSRRLQIKLSHNKSNEMFMENLSGVENQYTGPHWNLLFFDFTHFFLDHLRHVL